MNTHHIFLACQFIPNISPKVDCLQEGYLPYAFFKGMNKFTWQVNLQSVCRL